MADPVDLEAAAFAAGFDAGWESTGEGDNAEWSRRTDDSHNEQCDAALAIYRASKEPAVPDKIDTNAETLEMMPPPAPFEACDLCGVNVAPSWSRWEDGPCCGLRIACGECHAKVRAVLDRLLEAGKRLSLGAVTELARRLEQGPPAPPRDQGRHAARFDVQAALSGWDNDTRRVFKELAQALETGTEYPVELIAAARKWRGLVSGLCAQIDAQFLLDQERPIDRAKLFGNLALSAEDIEELRRLARVHRSGAGGLAAAIKDDGGNPETDASVKRARRCAELLADFAEHGRPFDGVDAIAASLGVASTTGDILRTIERMRADRDAKDRELALVARQATAWVATCDVLREVVPAEQMGGPGAVAWLVAQFKAAKAKAEDRSMPDVEAPPDGAPIQEVAAYVLACAQGWRPQARILGNARAEDIARMCESVVRWERGKAYTKVRWETAQAAADRIARQLQAWAPNWWPGVCLSDKTREEVKDRFASEIATWLRRPVPESGDYPPGYVERLVEAVCRLNLACEDDEAAGGFSPSKESAVHEAVTELRDLAFLPCPGCTEAAGSGLAVKHAPPLCPADRPRAAKEALWCRCRVNAPWLGEGTWEAEVWVPAHRAKVGASILIAWPEQVATCEVTAVLSEPQRRDYSAEWQHGVPISSGPPIAYA